MSDILGNKMMNVIDYADGFVLLGENRKKYGNLKLNIPIL